MALTDAQKAQVRRFLGYPDVNRDSALDHAMDALSAEGESLVGDLLTSLATVQATLEAAWDRQKVLKAEEVTLAGDAEIRALRLEGGRLAADLAAVLDVPMRRDPFRGPSAAGIAARG